MGFCFLTSVLPMASHGGWLGLPRSNGIPCQVLNPHENLTVLLVSDFLCELAEGSWISL